MRLVTAFAVIFLLSGNALAHVPDGDKSLIESMYHGLLGSHHLPVTVLLLVLCLALLPNITRRVFARFRDR